MPSKSMQLCIVLTLFLLTLAFGGLVERIWAAPAHTRIKGLDRRYDVFAPSVGMAQGNQ